MSEDSCSIIDYTADLFTTPLPDVFAVNHVPADMELVSISSEQSDSALVPPPIGRTPSRTAAPAFSAEHLATLYCAPQDIERNGLSSVADLPSNPKGQILIGCVPNLDPTKETDRWFYTNPGEACEEALRRLRFAITMWVVELRNERARVRGRPTDADYTSDGICRQAMLVLEQHQTETLHIHWAIKLDTSISLSMKAFRRLMEEYLVPWAGKWSMFKLGSCWQQLENYYMKNVNPRGLANATIVFYPVRTIRQVVQEQAIREKHGKNSFLQKN